MVGNRSRIPVAGLKVAPRAGSAVLFDNPDAEGMPAPDPLHEGLPVERGVKTLATLWLR